MANGVVVQFAVVLILAAVGVCVLVFWKKRNAQGEPAPSVPEFRPAIQNPQSLQSRPAPAAAPGAATRQPIEMELQVARAVPREPAIASASMDSAVTAPAAKAKGGIDMQGLVLSREDRNERILAGISENIRKSLEMRPVPQHSPIPYTDLKQRNTEYVRVKKEIITPHGQVRFSILKDWMSTNMLAVFRRASLDWKTPDDLIALVPAYLEPEAEVLNGRVLVVGTPGHNEKLAVPIRSLDDESALRDCFDFVTDVGTAANSPAVLLPTETEFEIVSRGVITQTAFMTAVEQGQTAVKLLADRSPETLQQSYSAALRGMA